MFTRIKWYWKNGNMWLLLQQQESQEGKFTELQGSEIEFKINFNDLKFRWPNRWYHNYRKEWVWD